MYGIITESGTQFVAEKPTTTEAGQINDFTPDQGLAMLFFSESAALYLASRITVRTGAVLIVQPNL